MEEKYYKTLLGLAGKIARKHRHSLTGLIIIAVAILMAGAYLGTF